MLVLLAVSLPLLLIDSGNKENTMYGKMMGGKAKETKGKGKNKAVPVTVMIAVGKPKMPMPMKGGRTATNMMKKSSRGK